MLAEQAVEKSWQDTPENMQIKTTGNLNLLFQRLKRNGVKIAIWWLSLSPKVATGSDLDSQLLNVGIVN